MTTPPPAEAPESADRTPTERFYVYNEDGSRREVLWSEATVEDHELAIERFMQIRDEVQEVIDRHIVAAGRVPRVRQ